MAVWIPEGLSKKGVRATLRLVLRTRTESQGYRSHRRLFLQCLVDVSPILAQIDQCATKERLLDPWENRSTLISIVGDHFRGLRELYSFCAKPRIPLGIVILLTNQAFEYLLRDRNGGRGLREERIVACRVLLSKRRSRELAYQPFSARCERHCTEWLSLDLRRGL
jgi:hypothetical protein